MSEPFRTDSGAVDFTDGTRLRGWETEVATELAGDVAVEQLATWGVVRAIPDILRPPRYHGSLLRIHVEPLGQPLEALEAAYEAQEKFSSLDLEKIRNIGAFAIGTLRGYLIDFMIHGNEGAQPASTIVWYHFEPGSPRWKPDSLRTDGPDIKRYALGTQTDAASLQRRRRAAQYFAQSVTEFALSYPLVSAIGTGRGGRNGSYDGPSSPFRNNGKLSRTRVDHFPSMSHKAHNKTPKPTTDTPETDTTGI